MLNIFQNIKGDKAIWAIAALLALFSFLPVYSASSNLVYVVGSGTPVGHLVKHAILLFLGFGIIYGVHKIPTHFFKGLSMIALPIVLVLLIFVLAQGTSSGGTNDSRWIRLPLVGFGFQPSNLAAVVLMIYVARYFSKVRDIKITFKDSILPLWLPVFLVVALILPANFSTAAIVFSMVMVLCFLGGYPMKYLLSIIGAGMLFLTMFVLTAKAFPDLFPNRVDTWMSRIDSFSNPEDSEGTYQIERAKIAIATGGVMGKGAGKSVQKNFLPQSSSDFIYAIIVEEYGLIGGFILMLFYMFLLFRIVVVANGCASVFSKLLVLGVGLPIVFQALINMAVAVELFPVTGQNLPLISSGGTSSWMTCLAIGIILSASNKSIAQESASGNDIDMDETNPLEILSGQL
ncbi:FtsW/RodA/SpoVE family cell cycle protein [Maribacter sp. 1_MG-2023]|uniref:FtsW/RodA/SpoVE family cell cycle protein n=1 Tax=Maribacter sp. 1_MG-2023 TaxID=3062677 RepID=UPI0026E36228|nr:FtsW/RodA/SpoVE family cell cycle protein [Maribacter sp. 1_MG-2023]MDO6473617.1 FtsW/RodA/SpoVE family cell cycle protein [Maribacter sp. 1_MG-2023]